MNSGAIFNAYPDSLGGHLACITELLSSPALEGAFGCFYILPSLFNYDLDRGFSIISYDINQEFADESQLRTLKENGISLKLDLVLNHLSVLSPQFQSILKEGAQSPYADFFINWNEFWAHHGKMTPDGYIQPDQALLADMFFRKPGLPLLMVRMPDGKNVPYWNTFYQDVRYPRLDAQDVMTCANVQYVRAQRLAEKINYALADGKTPGQIDWPDDTDVKERLCDYLESHRKYLGQMDVNLSSEKAWDFYRETLRRLAGYGASIIRLDAFAYAAKAPGKRNFFNEPETWEALERLRQIAQEYNLILLPEIHATYTEGLYLKLAQKGYAVYDFFLPGLLIDAIENQTSQFLSQWAHELLEKRIQTVNMLGCHDGVPMLDLRGLLPMERIQSLIDLMVSRGGMVKDLHGQKNIYYQVNTTYYSALGAEDRKLLLARAVQLFMPGKPQVWYLDLLAGQNDHDAVLRGGAAGHKEINRTNLTREQAELALQRPVVQKQLALLRMRNACPAFSETAQCRIDSPSDAELCLSWSDGSFCAELHVDFAKCTFTADADLPQGHFHMEA